MSFKPLQGTLKNVLISLTNGAPGPTNGLAPASDEWIDIWSVSISSSDTTQRLVTIEDSDGTDLFRAQVINTAPVMISFDRPLRVLRGKTLRALAPAVTAAATIEVMMTCSLSKT